MGSSIMWSSRARCPIGDVSHTHDKHMERANGREMAALAWPAHEAILSSNGAEDGAQARAACTT